MAKINLLIILICVTVFKDLVALEPDECLSGPNKDHRRRRAVPPTSLGTTNSKTTTDSKGSMHTPLRPARQAKPPSNSSSTSTTTTTTSQPHEEHNDVDLHDLKKEDFDMDDLEKEDFNLETTLVRSGILEFTYGEEDPKGPDHWDDLNIDNTSRCEFICCYNEHSSPLNIISSRVTLSEVDPQQAQKFGALRRTLHFSIGDGVANHPWTFGYPHDTWHGIQIRSKYGQPGLFVVIDEYNSHLEDGWMMSTNYNFEFAQVTYCEPHYPNKHRSSHQIDGKRFPLEINMLFFAESLADDVCFRKSIRETNDNQYVMVSVLGDLSKNDNKLLEPMIQAASKFTGKPGFDNSDLTGYTVPIPSPFSPTWFIQNKSNYYYYERGTFVVPPCYPIPRVYVMRSTITISERQLKVLTNIPSSREPSGKLSCTFGLLKDRITPESIHHSVSSIDLIGFDERAGEVKNEGIRHATKAVTAVSSLTVALLGAILVRLQSWFI